MDIITEEKKEGGAETEREESTEMTIEEKKAVSLAVSNRLKGISVKTAFIIALVIILAALVFYMKGWFIAATVNGSPVSRISVIHELERSSGKQTLEAIITKKLLGDEARKQGIEVTKDEVAAEIAKIENQIKTQGGTLEQVLASQGITKKDMEREIILQKELEKLLADKIAVTDEEVAALLAAGKITVPKGKEEEYKEQAKEQLRSQKLNSAAGSFLEALRDSASIRYFVNY